MIYDVIIIGGGPAGLTAAIYTSRARLKTLLVESLTVAGQAVTASDIENYPGFPEGINGFELIDRFKKQAGRFGAEFKIGNVKRIKKTKAAWQVELDGEELSTLSVIIAAGASPKKLNIPGEAKFKGKGISYCAVCDGAFFKNKDIVVMGGGNTAIEEAIFLTNFASKVTVIHRRNRLRATKILQERAFANKKINFVWDSILTSISGKDKVETIKVKNIKTNIEGTISCDGVFILVGYTPNTDFLKGLLKLDKNGYIVTDQEMKTKKRGIFAAGDARRKLLRQIVTASGEGAKAAFSARMYVEDLKGESYR